jgi:hypothetical protein
MVTGEKQPDGKLVDTSSETLAQEGIGKPETTTGESSRTSMSVVEIITAHTIPTVRLCPIAHLPKKKTANYRKASELLALSQSGLQQRPRVSGM